MANGAAWEESGGDGPRPPRPQRLPAARRRDQLIDAAIEAFGRGGYHRTSMDDIADAAGVTKPVLYQHFRSKRQLYQELLETIGAQLTSAVTSSAAAETPHQQVLAGFRAYFRFVAHRPSAFRLLFGTGARGDEGFTETVRVVEDRLAATIAGFISAGLDAEHRALLGYAIVGLAEVTGRKWAIPGEAVQDPGAGSGAGRLDQEELDQEEGERLAEWLADLVWAGLRGLPRAGPPPR